jgi:hypothetical protein
VTLINPGTYRAKPLAYQFGYTKDNKEQVLVDFRIVEECEFNGWVLPWFGFFTDKTWDRTLESLHHCGWVGDDLSDIGVLDQEVEIVVDIEPDLEGVDRNKVRWVNKIGAGRITLQKPMVGNDLKMFAAKMKARAGNRPQQQSARSSNSGSSQSTGRGWDDPPPPQDDDIPFAFAGDDLDRALTSHEPWRRGK